MGDSGDNRLNSDLCSDKAKSKGRKDEPGSSHSRHGRIEHQVSGARFSRVGCHRDPHLAADTLKLIRCKASQLAGRYGFSHDEFEDIQQSLIVDFLERSPLFVERRASQRGFARAIVNHCVATLIESKKAQRRGYGICHVSLSFPLDASSTHSSIVTEMIADPSQLSASGLQLRVDVAKTLATLPSELRQICLQLMMAGHMGDLAALIGVSRATLHRRVRTIRAFFQEAQLHRYVCLSEVSFDRGSVREAANSGGGPTEKLDARKDGPVLR